MAGTRIMVTNFDAVRQAEMWLTKGADEAGDVLLAMLRTALLLGGELVVDRNQLLDGIFFLSLGPDRIARQLGLEPGAALPLTMTCSPAPVLDGDAPRSVPRLRGTWQGPDPRAISMGRQLSDIRSARFLTASSSLDAITGRNDGPNPWLTPQPGPEWYSGAGFVDVLHPLNPDDSDSALARLHQAQDAWIDAAEHARIGVDAWGGEMDMPAALDEQRQALAEACDGVIEPALLAQRVLDVASRVRKDAVDKLSEWRQADPTLSDADLRLALRVWTRAYYQAIARKDDALLVSFNDPGESPAADARGVTAERHERSFGLALPVRSRWRRWLPQRRIPDGRRPMRVEGEIVDHLRIIDAGSFRQLTRASRSVVASLINNRDPDDMYDLALACRRAVDTGPTRRRSWLVTGIRAVSLSLMACLVAALTLLGELTPLTAPQRVLAVIAATALGLIAALPWDDILQQLRLRRSAMTAVINLQETP